MHMHMHAYWVLFGPIIFVRSQFGAFSNECSCTNWDHSEYQLIPIVSPYSLPLTFTPVLSGNESSHLNSRDFILVFGFVRWLLHFPRHHPHTWARGLHTWNGWRCDGKYDCNCLLIRLGSLHCRVFSALCQMHSGMQSNCMWIQHSRGLILFTGLI